MQIKIDMKILIFALIFFITNQIKIYILLMIFACLHELGHLVFGIILGFKPYLFEIKPIGFSVSFNNLVEDYNKKIKKANLLEVKKIFMYMTGPLVNFILAFIIYFFNINIAVKTELVYLNILLAFVNLLPLYPLDGGRILKCILCIFYGLKKSYIVTEKISMVVIILILFVSSILVLKVQNFGLLIIILYLVYIKLLETKRIKRKLALFELIEHSK
jgi:stage IV sporulation protein FB